MAGRAEVGDERALSAEAESAVLALAEGEIEAIVREVTDEEVAHYAEYGERLAGHLHRRLPPPRLVVLQCRLPFLLLEPDRLRVRAAPHVGWVMMRGLVDPGFAEEMLHVARELGGAAGADLPPARLAARGVEPYHRFMFSARM